VPALFARLIGGSDHLVRLSFGGPLRNPDA